jgi:hypothetical protein
LFLMFIYPSGEPVFGTQLCGGTVGPAEAEWVPTDE